MVRSSAALCSLSSNVVSVWMSQDLMHSINHRKIRQEDLQYILVGNIIVPAWVLLQSQQIIFFTEKMNRIELEIAF